MGMIYQIGVNSATLLRQVWRGKWETVPFYLKGIARACVYPFHVHTSR